MDLCIHAIVILGTGTPENLKDRIKCGHQLYKTLMSHKKCAIVIASGGNGCENDYSESHLIKKELAKDVPPNRIIEEPYSLNSIEQVLYVGYILKILLKTHVKVSTYWPEYVKASEFAGEPTTNDSLLSSIKVYIITSDSHIPVIKHLSNHFPMITNNIVYVPVKNFSGVTAIVDDLEGKYSLMIEQYKHFDPGSTVNQSIRLKNNKLASGDPPKYHSVID